MKKSRKCSQHIPIKNPSTLYLDIKPGTLAKNSNLRTKKEVIPMNTYVVDIDAAVSDQFVIKAKTASEAKRKAMKRFSIMKNFRFDVERLKDNEEPYGIGF